MYKLNEMYEKFVQKWGVEPNGLLINETTYQKIVASLPDEVIGVVYIDGQQYTTFRGRPVYRSLQMEVNEVKFVL